MKKLVVLLAVSLGWVIPAWSDLKIPSSVFEMEELEEAKAKALEDEEPLIFVYTDPGST